MAALAWLGSDGRYFGPAGTQTRAYGNDLYASLSRPLRKRFSNAVHGNKRGDATIVGLFDAGGPAAIVFGVVAVVVDAIKGRPYRAFPHIFAEGFERGPAWVHTNASTGIVGVFARAPDSHCHPRFISWRSRRAMSSVANATPAWAMLHNGQGSFIADEFLVAIKALGVPLRSRAATTCQSSYDKAPECFAGDVLIAPISVARGAFAALVSYLSSTSEKFRAAAAREPQDLHHATTGVLGTDKPDDCVPVNTGLAKHNAVFKAGAWHG